MEITKAYVDHDDTALLVCPHCKLARVTNVAKFKERKDALKVRCRCRNIYGVHLEFRRAYRKATSLEGRYSGPTGRGGRMTVKNVSQGGIGFLTSSPHQLKQGDLVSIEFKLDDGKDSVINRRAVVRVVEDLYVGVQFSLAAGAYDAALGFYLRK